MDTKIIITNEINNKRLSVRKSPPVCNGWWLNGYSEAREMSMVKIDVYACFMNGAAIWWRARDRLSKSERSLLIIWFA